MKRSRVRRGLVLVAVLGFVLALSGTTEAPAKTKACKKGFVRNKAKKCVKKAAAKKTTAKKSTATTGQADSRKPGGTITYLNTFEQPSLDPAAVSAVNPTSGAVMASAVFDQLVYVDAKSGDVLPGLAKSLTSTDAKVWTLKMRPGVKFTDGTPVDAAAVKYNWARMADPANKSPNLTTAASIKDMQVVDPQTLQVTLVSRNGQFPRLIASAGITFVGSPTALQADPDFRNNPVGAGPFMLKEWVHDDHLTLVRNPNYWDAPRPYVDKLVLKLMSDPAQRYNTFIAGQADIVTSYLDYSIFTRAKSAGFPTYPLLTPVGGGNVMFNVAKAPFDDIRVRTAVYDALDPDDQNQVMNNGDAATAPPPALIRQGSNIYDPDPSLRFPKHDHVVAQQLLDDLAKQNGGPLEFSLTGVIGDKNLEYMQSRLNQYRNLKVTIRGINGGDYGTTLVSGNFQAIFYLAGGFDPEPDFYNEFHTGASRNYWKFSHAGLDAALDDGRAALDPAVRRKAYARMEKILNDNYIASYFSPTIGGFDGGYVTQKDVKNFDDAITFGPPRWALIRKDS
ncbi:MAG: ABC transporter substrate-binding protein [Acidobacteria bacterium]|nr:ABC transporter substrate-binding protein [Acidobacteriota bacterium]